MNSIRLKTKRLDLALKSVEETRARIDELPSVEKEQLSRDWLQRVQDATSPDPWVHGFAITDRQDGVFVGECGFKGPPDSEGIVEVAYGIHPDHQCKGYATEAAGALVQFAFTNDDIRMVRAHTLPESNASTRVLTKCGFCHVGETMDPDDGLVWRWEKQAGRS